MSDTPTSHEDHRLRAALREVDARGEDSVRTARAWAECRSMLRRATPALPMAACGFVLLRALGFWPDQARGAPFWIWLVVLTLGPYLLVVLLRTIAAIVRPVAPGVGLGLADRQLQLKDRLRTAASFLNDRAAHESGSESFRLAAIEDAAQHVERARTASLVPPTVTTPSRRPVPAWGLALGALLLVLLGLWVSPWRPAPPSETEVVEAEPDLQEPVARRDPPREDITPDLDDPALVRAAAAAARAPQPRTAPRAREGVPGRMGDDVKASKGKTQAGHAAEAGAPTDAADAQSAPSEHGQAAEGGKRKTRKAKKPKPSDEKKPEAKKPDAVERSGATTGAGSSRGASRNPSSNSWSSKDQVPDAGSEAPSEEDDVDDEDEASEARGGMQPTMRSRKPPVNRDLGVGFGNRSNLDANGRGGPSQRKKSRGTASLILGVPVPDHIKGMPNPGRTKVTQERVEPQEDPAELLDASARTARRDLIGRVGSLDLSPWMQRLVKRFFLSRPTQALKPKKEGP